MNQEQKPGEQAQGMSSINEPPGSNTAQATGQGNQPHQNPNPNQQPPSGQPPHQPATSPKPGQPQQQPKPKHDEDDDNTAKRRK